MAKMVLKLAFWQIVKLILLYSDSFYPFYPLSHILVRTNLGIRGIRIRIPLSILIKIRGTRILIFPSRNSPSLDKYYLAYCLPFPLCWRLEVLRANFLHWNGLNPTYYSVWLYANCANAVFVDAASFSSLRFVSFRSFAAAVAAATTAADNIDGATGDRGNGKVHILA